jgi:hypothetical protein
VGLKKGGYIMDKPRDYKNKSKITGYRAANITRQTNKILNLDKKKLIEVESSSKNEPRIKSSKIKKEG